MHELAAMRPGHEFWLIDQADQKNLNKAIADVLRWYSIKATQKAIDHFALAVLLWRIETPRFILETKQRRAETAQAPPQAPPGAKVFRFREGTTAPAVEMPAGEPVLGGV
jgi:hypothetical protein